MPIFQYFSRFFPKNIDKDFTSAYNRIEKVFGGAKLKKIKEFLLMSFGAIVLAIGVYFFKIPNGFSTGGVSGIGTILSNLTPISAGVWIWCLNIFLLLIGFIFLGRKTGIKTVWCSLLYSTLTFIFEFICPLSSPLSDQPFLELVYAMLLTSIGSAIIFNANGSAGGTDIVALILKKYTRLNVGKALLIVDFVVAASSFFVFGIETGLFSLLGLFAKAFIVDAVIENFNTCKYFVVITTEKEKISDYIIKNLHHGATSAVGIGEYTGEEKAIIHTVCKRIEAIRLRSKIKELDPHAFIIITTSSEIIGRGFRNI